MTWNPDYNPPTAQQTSKPLPRLASETTADNPWPVSLLSEKFYTAVERWPSVWVAGQITQINTRRQGSAYITLRDDQQDIAMKSTASDGSPRRRRRLCRATVSSSTASRTCG